MLGGTTTLSVNAVGPTDSVADGVQDAGAYSNAGADMALVAELSQSSSFGFHDAQLDLHSAKGGSAYVSLFDYAQSPSATFRCKVNGSAFVTQPRLQG
jgi:hypothetical protein